jgi:type IV pilus assembly protein PilB
MKSLIDILKTHADLKDINLQTLFNESDLSNKDILDKLIKNHHVGFKILSNILYREYKFNSVILNNQFIDEQVAKSLSYQMCVKYCVLAINDNETYISVAMANPFDYEAIENIELVTNKLVKIVFSELSEITAFISKVYTVSNIENITSKFTSNNEKYSNVSNADEIETVNAPAVKIVNQIIDKAAVINASDIHIEPQELQVRIRYRVDGELIETQKFDSTLLPLIISRIKIMGNMDISEKRLPQEGRFKREVNKIKLDFRVSIIPTVFGEKAVIRLIYSDFKIEIASLGLLKKDIDNIYRLFKNTNGAVLITGPTGSGKSTTLFAFMSEINKENVNIVTIEDPVETIIKGISQISINVKKGFDFADALRFILRQDPDIIMVGEIRDQETAKLAIRGAMTGHLVLSTLHTNDSLSAISRLIDMGVPSYLVTSTLKGVISQRLVRRLCGLCKKKDYISTEDTKILNLPEETIVYSHVGCVSCNNTGFSGRFAVVEILFLNNDLQNLIESKMPITDIRQNLKKNGMKFLYDSVLDNVLNGNTTINEMYKIIY